MQVDTVGTEKEAANFATDPAVECCTTCGTNGYDYLPFVTYMLGVMGSCYRTLDERFALLSSSGTNEDALRAYFDKALSRVTKRQIMDDNPFMSQHTVERILQKLQAEVYIEKIGAARTTAYRRVRG